MKNLFAIILFIFISVNVFAADTKTTALPEMTTPVGTDILMVVDDPGGTAASQKITYTNLLKVGTTTQAYSSVLDTYAGIDPAANIQSLLAAANYAAFMVLLDGSDRTGTGAWDLTGVSSLGIGPLTFTAGSASTAEGAMRWTTSPAGLADNVMSIGNGSATEYFLQYLTLPTTDGQFWIYDETSDLIVPLAMSGDATMTELGVVSLAANSVDSAQYVDGSIDLVHMSTDSVDYTKTTGSFKALTPVSGSTTGFAAGFTGANLYGGTYVVTSDTGDLQLPALAAGMNFTLITSGAIQVVAATNANDGYMLDGVDTAEDNSIVNTSTTGDIATIQYYTADDWLITTNGWSTE